MEILTVVGARPQFIKAAPVSKALRQAGLREFLVHTGQHYDANMSQVFFNELYIPEPDINLNVGSGSHGLQTGQILIGIDKIIQERRPDWVLVYGDTNSTLAGALAACKLGISLAHVEAGLRSFNRRMPEEHNRVLTDHCSDLLFCPTQTAVDNLKEESVVKGVYFVGDAMYDAVLQFADLALLRSNILQYLGIIEKEYLLATVHRPCNTDNQENLLEILQALQETNEVVIFPVHPRTSARIASLGNQIDLVRLARNVKMIEPVGYLDMLLLERQARMILTDSGGIQKEAYFLKVPCITLRTETEWVETVNEGWNILTGSDRKKILAAVHDFMPNPVTQTQLFGNGQAAERIAAILGEGR